MIGKGKATGRAAVYLRVSTTEQDLTAQKQAVGRWAKNQEGLKLEREYKEKISGSGGYVRKEMNAMLADARSHRFDIAIFNDFSRLGRNVYEAMKIVHEFADNDVKVAVCDVDMVWDLADPICNLVAGTLAIVAQFESDEGKKRTRRGIDKKGKEIAREIKGGALPPGTRIGMPGLCEKYVTDPNGREKKKGLLVAPSPKRAALFEAIWLDDENEHAYDTIRELLRVPVNPKCKYGCKPKTGGRAYRSLTAKCFCGNKPSRPCVHKTRKRLGLPARKAHSFKRSSVRVASHDILMAEYLDGDVDDEDAAAAPAAK